DNIAHDLAERFSLLGWAVPLYVWSLHPQADDQAGRIVQSVGSLFPPDCQSSQMRQLLSALPSRLLETGVQQVTGNPQHHFLLGLADQLTRQPERISVPLSTFLEPHRALPLAGVVFSPSSPQASHSLKHHWRHDKRWDVLLESLR
ncbi:type VI secretion protein VasK, partial [Escherichia coli]|nr:type VI secretion protein VasK [Escherichia coli]